MSFSVRLSLISLLLSLLVSCEVQKFHRALPPVMEFGVTQTQVGIASIYKDHRTASGERFRASALAAAHRTWPMGTRVRVTHLGNGRTVIVRINDRGPFIRGRVIDLTPSAATAIGLTTRQGVARVKLERLR
jgi:rare lipoprotein A